VTIDHSSAGVGRILSDKSIKSKPSPGVALIKRDEPDEPAPPPSSDKLDFDSDLRNALARRRSKVEDRNATGSPDIRVTNKNVIFSSSEAPKSNASRFDGLSLRESVRENVAKQPKGAGGGKPQQHSPPPVVAGFGNKKDSGYTSSRTSLEPSECGDSTESHYNNTNGSTMVRVNEDDHQQRGTHRSAPIPPPPPPRGNAADDFPPPPPPECLNAAINSSCDVSSTVNRVSMLSQQLEDSFGGQPPPALPRKPIGLRTQSSTNSINRCNNNNNNPAPMVIYDHDTVCLAHIIEVGVIAIGWYLYLTWSTMVNLVCFSRCIRCINAKGIYGTGDLSRLD
jgi:hypothetical protein